MGLQRKGFAAVLCIACLLLSDVAVGPARVLSCTEADEATDCASGEQCVCSSSHLDGDPHLELTGPDGQKLTWDFHGSGNQSYCMVTDKYIALNTHMFTLPLDVKVIKQEVPEVEPFFEGTWVDGVGLVYKTQDNKDASIEIFLDQKRARVNSHSITIRFRGGEGDAVQVLDDASNWTSSDGLITISQEGNAAHIFMPELLTMVVKVEPERELITEPPIYCLNFEIKTLYTTPDVHGFLGQMHAPGAVAKRLQMGTLEGLMHREYVEGTDDDYATSNLTATDCFFNRFGMDGAQTVQSHASHDAASSISNWRITPGRRLLQMRDFESASKPDSSLHRRASLETQCECVSKSCSDSTTCKATQECCGGSCTSPLTLTLPACGFIAVYRRNSTAPADLLGYVKTTFSPQGLYTVSPAMTDALKIRFDQSYEYSAFAVNGRDPRFPYVGAVSDYLGDPNIGVGSDNLLTLAAIIAPPPPSSTPRPARVGGNSYADRFSLADVVIEDAIWTLGGECGALNPQWVNSDFSKPATYVVLYGNILLISGDEDTLAKDLVQSVSVRFVPVGECSA